MFITKLKELGIAFRFKKKSHIVINVLPKPKQSVKTFVTGGRAIHYQPADVRNYVKLLQMVIKARITEKITGVPCYVIIFAFFPFNSTDKKPALNRGWAFHWKKPDCDNISKPILDALDGLAIDNDSNFAGITVFKFKAPKPRLEIFIYELNY